MSAPPTSFQFFIFPVNISINCCFVKDSTLAFGFVTAANPITHTLLSFNAAASIPSLSFAYISEFPISTLPSDTNLSPVPLPPP